MWFKFVFILMLLFPFNISAKVSFEAGVNVETQGENSVIAKQRALNKAYREAFLKVGSRLISAQNIKKLDTLTDEQILHFIREVEVVAEKITSNSYRADLNIKINDNLLQQYLLENNLLSEVAQVSKILVIPIYSDTDYAEKVLFEDGNVWRNAWLKKGQIKSGIFNFEVLSDTKENKDAIQDLNINEDSFEKLRYINASDNIFTANAIRAGQNTLVVTLKSLSKKYHKSFVVNDENSFDEAIEQTVHHITDFVENKSDAKIANAGQIDVLAYLKLKDWLEIEKKLNNLSSIKQVTLKIFSLGKVVFSINYSSGIDNLIEILAKQRLYLQNMNGVYTLKI